MLHEGGLLNVEGEQGRIADFHSLRHSTATSLSQAGTPPRRAQAILRRAHIDTTMATFTHLDVLDYVGAVEALSGLSDSDETEAGELRKEPAQSTCPDGRGQHLGQQIRVP